MFSRQILINHKNSKSIQIPCGFKHTLIDNYDVYYHELNEVNYYKSKTFECMVIGTIVYPEQTNFNLEALLSDCNTETTFELINQKLSRCCGRYYLLYNGMDGAFLRSDATSLAQINYSGQTKQIATDINLLKQSGLNVTKNKRAEKFYKEVFPKKGNGNAWVGDETPFNEISKVLPNHALNLNSFDVVRYWPWKKFTIERFEHAVENIARELQLLLQAFSEVSPLSIAVTAGNDSRIMAAAAKPIKGDVYYFVDKLSFMDDNHSDIVIGRTVCDALNVNFNVHRNFELLDNVPEEFKSDYFESVFYALPKRLPEVYYYSKHLHNRINICGVGEYGRSVYGEHMFDTDTNFLCYKYQCINSSYANTVTHKWMTDIKKHEFASSYPINTLYYCEQRLGNWGAVGNAESDIAFEEVNPFASHAIIEKMICLNPKFTTYTKNQLFSQLINTLAPELNTIPINPKSSFLAKLKAYFKGSSSFRFIDKIKYRLSSRLGAKTA
ncbi:hypothetical protein [Pseudoalteromonas marina]|jgi:hypothetical protein|uniref:Asparagine synthetase domain-containing protein n=1 Tax=Pseudoalteromonas marina TaxID=267375 RepID=A0ABT9FB79_9GAMM|nr:hypothetical protein [Pseudoalteromonas marina]MDP2564049.1 hypothetical protein [Pseudoalteromonas marina]